MKHFTLNCSQTPAACDFDNIPVTKLLRISKAGDRFLTMQLDKSVQSYATREGCTVRTSTVQVIVGRTILQMCLVEVLTPVPENRRVEFPRRRRDRNI